MSISSQMQPKLSEGQDESQVIKDAEELLEREWQLDDNSMGLRKMFFFKSYTKALDFVQVVGIRSKSKNHHPVMIVRTGSVDIHWTTHHPKGLSAKDTFMAQYCDERAREIGTVEQADALKCAPT